MTIKRTARFLALALLVLPLVLAACGGKSAEVTGGATTEVSGGGVSSASCAMLVEYDGHTYLGTAVEAAPVAGDSLGNGTILPATTRAEPGRPFPRSRSRSRRCKACHLRWRSCSLEGTTSSSSATTSSRTTCRSTSRARWGGGGPRRIPKRPGDRQKRDGEADHAAVASVRDRADGSRNGCGRARGVLRQRAAGSRRAVARRGGDFPERPGVLAAVLVQVRGEDDAPGRPRSRRATGAGSARRAAVLRTAGRRDLLGVLVVDAAVLRRPGGGGRRREDEQHADARSPTPQISRRNRPRTTN